MVREYSIAAALAYEETERIHFLRINMAEFTAYIFKEDVQKLNSEAGFAGQKCGSLFGQWTSTGNPVVHYVVPSTVSRADSERYGAKLWDDYRLCHIGEWRSVRPQRGQNVQDAGRHLLSNFKDGKPKRFLVLDVEVHDIKPHLFESETQRRSGKVESLDGENPFNRPDTNPQPSTGRHFHQSSHHQGQSNAAQGRDWLRPQPRPQLQPADTRYSQWYSAPKGNEKLGKAFEDFKKIASQDHVEMTRDVDTQDISMVFRDQRNLKKWKVDFPSNFPYEGALLIEDPDLRSKCKKYRQSTNTNVNQAVKNMISHIQQSSFLK